MRTHITIAIFAAAIILTLPSGSFSDQETEPSKDGKPSISISAGSTNGLYTYTSHQILGLMVEKGEIDGEKSKVMVSEGSQENIDRLLDGESTFAIIQSDILSSNKQKIDSQTTTQPQIFAIASLYPEFTQILVNKDSGIEKVSQLKNEKKLFVGKKGSGGRASAIAVLSSAGFKVDPEIYGEDELDPDSVTRDDALESLCHPDEHPDLKVDAVFRTTSSILPEIDKWKDCLRLVSLDKVLLDTTLEANDYYEFTNLIIGGESINLIYIQAVLTVADNVDVSGKVSYVPDQLIKDLAKVVHLDLPDAFYSTRPKHSNAGLFKGTKIFDQLPVPYHPAALSYLKEKVDPIITISGGSESGLYTYTSKQLKKLLEDDCKALKCGTQFEVSISKGSQNNIDRLDYGKAQLAIVQSDILFRHVKPLEEADNPSKLVAIAALYPEFTQILVNKDSNIENVIQLAGKTVYVGKVGSGGEVNARVVLSSTGLKADPYGSEGLDYIPTADSVKRDDALESLCHPGIEKPGLKVDAVFRTTSSILPKLAKWKGCLRLVSLDPDLHEAIIKSYPYYGLTNMNIGGENINLLYTRAVLAVADVVDDGEVVNNIPDDIIGNLARSIHNNFPVAFYSNQPKNSNAILFKDEKIVAHLPIDYHPAAKAYYKDKGLLKSKLWKLITTILIVWVTFFFIKINTSNRSHREQRAYAWNKIWGFVFEFTGGQLIWLAHSVIHFLQTLWKSLSSLAFFKSPITITISGLLVFLWVAMVAILFSESDHAVSHDIPNQFDNIDTPSFLIWMLQTLTMGESPDGIVPKSMVAKTITVIIPIIGVVGAFLAVLVSSVKNKSVNERRARGLEIPPLTKHLVICGWNDHGVRVVEEIGTGAPNRPPNEIVVLDESDGDKPLEHLGLTGENIHFLRGMSSDSENLKLVSAKNARGFLVLAGKKKITHQNFRSIFTVQMIANQLEGLPSEQRPNIMVDMVFSKNLDMFCEAGADRVLNTRLIGTVFLAYSALNMGFSNVITSLMSLATRPVISRLNASDKRSAFTKVIGMDFPTAWDTLFGYGINLLAIIPHKGETSPTMGIYPDLVDPIILEENDHVITDDDGLIIMENQALSHESISAVSFADSRTDVQNGLDHSSPLVVIDRRNESDGELKSLLEKRCGDLYYICADDSPGSDDDSRFIAWDGAIDSICDIVREHVLDDLDRKGKTGNIKVLVPTVDNPHDYSASSAVHKDDDTIALILQLNTLKTDRFHYTAEIKDMQNLRLFKGVGVQQTIPVHEFASLALTKMTLFDGEVTGLILRLMENFFTGKLENKSLRKISLKGTGIKDRLNGVNYRDATSVLFHKGIQLLAIISHAGDDKHNRLVALPRVGDEDYNYKIHPEDELIVIS